MDYKRIYEQLVNRAKSREKPSGYCEKHHIIPKALGGSNKKENLVYLTLREHWIAHQLIFRMQEDKNLKIRMHIPLRRMSKQVLKNFNGRKYEWIRSSFYKFNIMNVDGIRKKVSEGVVRDLVSKKYKPIICRCGCGGLVRMGLEDKGRKFFINGHSPQSPKNIKKPSLIECACGCGGTRLVNHKKLKDKNYIHGHNRPDPKEQGKKLSAFLSSLSKEELSLRSKASFGAGDQELRAKNIRKGKQSFLRATFDDGRTLDFSSIEIPEEISLSYGIIKDLINRKNGRDENLKVTFIFTKKYEGGNKWLKK